MQGETTFTQVIERPAAPSLPMPTHQKPPSWLRVHVWTIVLAVAVFGFGAAAAFGWKTSFDRGTTIKNERAATASKIGELNRDKAGLESQVSSLQGSVSDCKQAIGEIASVASILVEYRDLVGQAAYAAAAWDAGELGRVVGNMEALDEQLSSSLTSTSSISRCGGSNSF